MSDNFKSTNVLEPVIKEGTKCKYCDFIVNNNDEYLKHLVDNHWKEYIKDCFNVDLED